jgi:hypothetical protein
MVISAIIYGGAFFAGYTTHQPLHSKPVPTAQSLLPISIPVRQAHERLENAHV